MASGVEKVLVIVEENRSVADVAAHMPFLTGQGRRYATASNYFAIRHPSLPNYLMMAGGSTFDDEDPDVHRLPGPSVFGQLLARGQSVKTYAEASHGNCALRNHGTYAVRHNPWTYFNDPAERRACHQLDVPSGTSAQAVVRRLVGSAGPGHELRSPDRQDRHEQSLPTGTGSGEPNAWRHARQVRARRRSSAQALAVAGRGPKHPRRVGCRIADLFGAGECRDLRLGVDRG